MRFANRRDAGRLLAERLARHLGDQPVVAALPRGGVPVAYEIARVLSAPLDVLAVRKLGAPAHDEYAVGAIAEGDIVVIDEPEARRAGLTGAVRERKLAIERRELGRRAAAYRGMRPPADLAGRVVVVVDDGLATGLTAIAAVRAVRAQGAARIIVAVPVAAPEAVQRVGEEADEVVAVLVPPRLRGVGEWYDDFAQTGDEEVLDLLARGRSQSTTDFAAVRLRD